MHFAARRLLVRLVAVAFVIALAGCNNSTLNLFFTGSSEHLYVTNAAGQILQFNLPLTSGSAPAAIVANPANPLNFAIAVDSNGNLATSDDAGHLAIYNAPISNMSTPAVVFTNGTPAAGSGGSLAFSSAGDLFATARTSVFPPGPINLFKHPFSSATTVAQVITDNRSIATPNFVSIFDSVVLDANDNLYIIGHNGAGDVSGMFAPPYTSFAPGTSIIGFETQFGALAASKTQLFTGGHRSVNQSFINIDPLPSASSFVGISFTLTQSGSAGGVTGLGVDSAGNLYVADNNDNTIRVFAPPFSSTSLPTVTLQLASAPAGVAVGK